MKVKIIKTYADKNTGKTMEAGKVIEVNPHRAKELIDAGVVERVKKERTEK